MQLDLYQEKAVNAVSDRLRVLAGAGSGKTRVLIARAKRLLASGVRAERLLLITFSKKAAKEMTYRLAEEGVSPVPLVCTIHSLAYRILRAHPVYRRWYVTAESQSGAIIAELLKKLRSQSSEHVTLAEVRRALSQARLRYCPLSFRDFVRGYEARMAEIRAFDYDGLLIYAHDVLLDSAYAAQWNNWEHVLVDEAQDTDVLQWRLIRYLVGPCASIFVVGDVSQSIYGFRGAVPSQLAGGLEHDFGRFETIELPINYRSLPQIVHVANRVVDGARGALSLQPSRMHSDRLRSVFTYAYSPNAGEAMFIAEKLTELHKCGLAWGEMAVLYRLNAQSEPLEHALEDCDIPFRIAGGYGFYRRAEIRDLVAYLRLSQRCVPDALERIFNRPNRFLGKAFVAELMRQGGWEALWHGRRLRFARSFTADGAAELGALLKRIRGQSASRVLELVMDCGGYLAWLKAHQTDDGDDSRERNVETLREAVERYPTLDAFLAYVANAERRPDLETQDAVMLSTVHKAKGLEWPVVILAGCKQGTMPFARGDRDEERRVLYVAMTRAKDRLIVVCNGRPSEFEAYMGRAHNGAKHVELSVTSGHVDQASMEGGNGREGSLGADGDADGSARSVIDDARGGLADDGEREAGGVVDGDVRGVLAGVA